MTERPRPRLSYIVPTIGRASIKDTMQSLLAAGLSIDDEVVVVADGYQDETALLFIDAPSNFQFHTTPATHDYGNAQRDFGMSIATGDYICFMDDDDVAAPNAIDEIKSAIEKDPGSWFMFRMAYLSKHNQKVIWDDPLLPIDQMGGRVGTPMFVIPNNPKRFGTWNNGHGYGSDFKFIVDTCRNFGGDPAWRKPIIALIG